MARVVKPWLGLLLLATIAIGASCGSSAGDSASPAEERLQREPAVVLPAEAATTLDIDVVTQGSGLAVGADDTVIVDYVGRSLSTGEVFDSSWQRDQPTSFGLDQVMTGWKEGLAGMQEGGRRQLTIPPGEGFGAEPPPDSGIGVDDTLVFVVDLHRVVQVPEVVLPDSAAEELIIEDLIEGVAAEATATSRVKVHYTGVSLASGQVFDSSWNRGEVAEFTFDEAVLEGWREGLIGMKVGGRRRLVVPPSLGFKDEPPAETGVAPNDTLVFVIDLLGVS